MITVYDVKMLIRTNANQFYPIGSSTSEKNQIYHELITKERRLGAALRYERDSMDYNGNKKYLTLREKYNKPLPKGAEVYSQI